MFAAAAIFAASLAVGAQTTKLETGCSTDESRRLAFLEGDWKVESRFRISSRPEKWETTEAVSNISPVFPGCLWEEAFEGIREGEAIRIVSLYGFSNVSNRFQHTWAHSQHGMLTNYEGRFENGVLTFETTISILILELRLRKVIRRNRSGFEVRSARSTDNGKTWDETWVLTYRGPDTRSRIG